MQLGDSRIQFEEDQERLKIEWPVERNRAALIVYTALIVVWLVALGLFIYLLFDPPTPRGIDELPTSLAIVWIGGVLIWLYVWARLIGRMLLRWWQYHLARRQIMYIDKKTLVLRRPVSLFGNTDAYDMAHVSAFYENKKHNSIAFRYGNVRHILFGQTLPPAEREQLLYFLNRRFFPYSDDDEEV